MKTIIRIYQNRLGLLSMILLCTTLWMSSCKEHIDMSDRFTFLEETVWSYLEKNDSLYSEYISLLKTVPISSISTSTVAQLLSARGHYTCFAPNNKAIQEYLDSLYRKGLITEPSWDGFATERAKDSIQKVIVYNSIIDGGDVIYYDIANFPTRNNDEFSVSNMNDRRLSVVRDSLNPDIILINGEYPISLKNRDIEAINGYVHEMETVIAPSNETITDILRTWINEGGSSYTVMARLVLACGLGDTLSKVRDEVFEQMMLKGEIEDIGDFKTNKESGLPSDHRNYGFT
ncbi:MAG: fasciclin domain-containing protein, partial [Prevotella sp.]|nr:fasciclin domain-containing protein [Prevotella sp.]